MGVHVGKFLTPGDLVGKMKGTCKQWSKVNWNLMYENLTPTNDPIAVFKKIDEEKFFLEDPMNLLDPEINGLNASTINFSTVTWQGVFNYSCSMRCLLRQDRFNRLFSENASEFMKALAINAAQNCPLDFEVMGWSLLEFAVMSNDVDVASILFQRGAANARSALELALHANQLEMV